jgi:DNA-binding NarL/FixJ family response regulator
MSRIQVLLADDHALVRAGIRMLLESFPGIDIVGEASDGRRAVELVKSKRPDVVLMDIAMPGLNGLEAVSRLSKDYPDVRVIILSMHATEEYVLKALQAGARGYLIKDAATTELELAVRSVAYGRTYLSPSISNYVVDGYVQGTEEDGRTIDTLTSRQREILQLIAEGCTTKEIAEMLKVSVKTVESHRSRLMERINVHDVAGLVRYAIRVGLVSPEK